MNVFIRKFTIDDIENKVKWINDQETNQFLHYDLPLEVEKTRIWYEQIKQRTDRYDAIIEVDGVAVGLIGLLSIDNKHKKSEYYIAIGDKEYKGRGIAAEATRQILEYAFYYLRLEKVYLYTEAENYAAQKLFRKVGFKEEGLLKNDIFSRGKFISRFIFGITKSDYLNTQEMTPINRLGEYLENNLFIKREDLLPYSFGGNKVRKANLFFKEINKGKYDCIVTYGSSHSNHCRIVANMSAEQKLPCYIITPEKVSDTTYNSQLMALFHANIEVIPVKYVHETIEKRLEELRNNGYKPYFIPGGGHGDLGTQAYVRCYDEILAYERKHHIHFDYIFFASGTGTTHAGLVCGQLLQKDDRCIVGISIARKKEYGKKVIIDSINSYLQTINATYLDNVIKERTIFIDDFIDTGYGKTNQEIINTINDVMIRYGIPLDGTYTGKAFYGMKEYIRKENIKEKKILFIHTGGTPLFFDGLNTNKTISV